MINLGQSDFNNVVRKPSPPGSALGQGCCINGRAIKDWLPRGLMVKTSASHDGSTDSNPVAGAPS